MLQLSTTSHSLRLNSGKPLLVAVVNCNVSKRDAVYKFQYYMLE